MNVRLMLVGIALAVPMFAAAQVMKCVGPDGRVTYSDRVCEGNQKPSVVYVDPNAGSIDGNAYLREAHVRRQMDRPAAPPVASYRSSQSGGMSDFERQQRIRSLEVDINSPGTSTEARRAAREELSRIHRGVVEQRSAADEQRMRNLQVDLNSIDANTRRSAERQMEQMNDRYESTAHIQVREAQRAAEAADRAARRADAAQAQRSAADAAARARQMNEPKFAFELRPTGQRTAVDSNGETWNRSNNGAGYVNPKTGRFVAGEARR